LMACSKSLINSFSIFCVTFSMLNDCKPYWQRTSDCQMYDCWVSSVRRSIDMPQSRTGF
jgi:hypothetical protein